MNKPASGGKLAGGGGAGGVVLWPLAGHGGGVVSIGKARGFLYALARLLGDVQAVKKGPGAMARRVARRAPGKATGQLLRRLFG